MNSTPSNQIFDFEIEGMTDDASIATVRTALEGIGGIQVESVRKGAARIRCENSQVELAERAVNDAGFHAAQRNPQLAPAPAHEQAPTENSAVDPLKKSARRGDGSVAGRREEAPRTTRTSSGQGSINEAEASESMVNEGGGSSAKTEENEDRDSRYTRGSMTSPGDMKGKTGENFRGNKPQR